MAESEEKEVLKVEVPKWLAEKIGLDFDDGLHYYYVRKGQL
ncbi:MAG: hypothetical protein ABWW65_02400 [Thermoprotei archaeon]